MAMHPASDFDRAVPDLIQTLSKQAMRFRQHAVHPSSGAFDSLALLQGNGMLGTKRNGYDTHPEARMWG